MGISLKPQHLNRYRQIAWLFVKYGRSDLVKETGLDETLEAEQRVSPKEAAKAGELAADLEKLGPTFIKLGQLLSSRVELLLRELDYRQEANNLTTIGAQLEDFERIVVPAPILDYSTSRVLTMQYVHGKKITDLNPLTRMEFDAGALAEELFRAYLQQILVNGFFHADPHPGNVFLSDDYRIALIDLGMVGRIMPGLQEQLLQLLLAISEGRGDDAAGIAIKIGYRQEDFAEKEFTEAIAEIIAKQQGATVDQMQVGR